MYGHHPWKSFGSHGNCDDILDELYEKINRANKADSREIHRELELENIT